MQDKPKPVKLKLSLIPKQAAATSQALDLLTRMGLGQMREIANLVRHGVIPFNCNREFSHAETMLRLESIDDLCSHLSRQLGFEPNESYGIGSANVPVASKRAYEVSKVLDKALAEHNDSDPKFRGVNYDGLTVRYTGDEPPTAKVVAAEDESAITLDNQVRSADEDAAKLDAALMLEVIQVRLPSNTVRELEMEAKNRGLPLSALLRNILQSKPCP